MARYVYRYLEITNKKTFDQNIQRIGEIKFRFRNRLSYAKDLKFS